MSFKDFIECYKRMWADKFGVGCSLIVASIWFLIIFGLFLMTSVTIFSIITLIIGLRLVIKNKPEDFSK